MTWLYVIGSAMLFATIWYLVRPLALAGGGQHVSEQWHQLTLVRDRLLGQIRELEQQAADGVLDQAVVKDERLRLEAELAPVLRDLESLPETSAPTLAPLSIQRRRLWLVVMAAFVLPLTAGLYVINSWSTFQGLYGSAQTRRAAAPAAGTMPPMVMQMVERLENRLKASPQDPDGWARLGRAYSVLGRLEEARAAYARAYEQAPDNNAIVAAYAGFLYQINPSETRGEVRSVYTRLRRLEPNHPGVLWFFGVVAYEDGNYQRAIESWSQLMRFLPEGSPAKESVNKAIAQAEAELKTGK